MKTRRILRFTAAALVCVSVGVGSPSAAGPGQLQNLRAEWQDLGTWSRYIESSRENELGLGFQLNGPDGTVFLGLLGRLDVRNPTAPPRELLVQVGIPKLGNPMVVRQPVLAFTLDAQTSNRAVIDLGSRLVVDDPSPGAPLESGLARMSVADFVGLTRAQTVAAKVLGFDVRFRDDQRQALVAFADRLHIQLPR